MTTVRKKQISQEIMESEKKEEAPITTSVPDSTSTDEKTDDAKDKVTELLYLCMYVAIIS